MTELSQPTATVDSSNGLIREIALTNQISVQWEELRAVLKQRLDQVLESEQLIYTEPSVTNPLTTKLAPLTSADAGQGQVDIQTPLSSAETTIPLLTAPASQDPVVASQDTTEDQDQAHVPEQSPAESKQEQASETSKESDQTLQQKPEIKGEGEETKVEAGSGAKENVEGQAEGEKAVTEGTIVSPEENRSDSGATVAAATAAGEVTENGLRMVPISKDTLLVETPEGYRTRINSLLDAFTSAPFTIQRVCELLYSPTEHHTNLIKYLRAVEKVLMITSSINEFSNPAYNGPSALDEDRTSVGAEPMTANGDYSRATNLDFALISEEVPSLTSEVANEQEVYAATNEHGDSMDSTSTSEDIANDEQSADKNDGESGMDVERTGTAADMDVDLNGGLNTMDGVEAEASASTSQEEGQDDSSDIQVDTEVDGGMELDQA
ncbi:protein phosphatase 4, regulatory subunit 2 [Mortierella sp. AD094]|nr:protein phosphatase 4, regulatory subunit 2 [Mortierella sp. AD094]